MKKNISCISQAISFVSGNFLYFIRMSFPLLLLFALAITSAYWALNNGSFVLLVCCLLLAFFAFVLLQGIIYGLWEVKQKGFEIELQKSRSVYKTMIIKVEKGLTPRNILRVTKYFLSHIKPMFSLTVCSCFLYGLISIIIVSPLITLYVIRNAILRSQLAGDIVSIPNGLSLEFYVVFFFVSLVLLVINAPSILPYKLRKQECDKEDAEIERIVPKVQ